MNCSQRLVHYKQHLLQNHCLKFHKLNLLVHEVIQAKTLVLMTLAQVLALALTLMITFNLRLK